MESVSGGLAGRGCERKGPGRKAGEDRHEVSYPPGADHHKAKLRRWMTPDPLSGADEAASSMRLLCALGAVSLSKNTKKPAEKSAGFLLSRGTVTRTQDPLVPNQMR